MSGWNYLAGSAGGVGVLSGVVVGVLEGVVAGFFSSPQPLITARTAVMHKVANSFLIASVS